MLTSSGQKFLTLEFWPCPGPLFKKHAFLLTILMWQGSKDSFEDKMPIINFPCGP